MAMTPDEYLKLKGDGRQPFWERRQAQFAALRRLLEHSHEITRIPFAREES